MMKAYEFDVKLSHSNPLIWRKIVVPAGITFKRLHDTIQMAMGWWDYHLYEFRIEEAELRFTIDEEQYAEHKYMKALYANKKLTKEEDPYGFIERAIRGRVQKAQSSKIDSHLEKHNRLDYIYDFGDGWEHSIELIKIVDDYPFGYPIIIDGAGDCPPEDVGGISGYEDFLKIWNDPQHPDYEHMRSWGESQNFEPYDQTKLNRLLKEFIQLKKVK